MFSVFTNLFLSVSISSWIVHLKGRPLFEIEVLAVPGRPVLIVCERMLSGGEGLFALKFNGSPLLLVLRPWSNRYLDRNLCQETHSPFRNIIIWCWCCYPTARASVLDFLFPIPPPSRVIWLSCAPFAPYKQFFSSSFLYFTLGLILAWQAGICANGN